MTKIRTVTKTGMAAIALAAGTVAQAGEPITAPGPAGDLSGTLVRPAADKPVILIIPGSGPTDRDGNSPLGISAGSYRLLAEGLADEGIGSIRIDKRGMFASKDAVADANAVRLSDYRQDVAAWIASARTATGAECLWLAGHSEGGLVALASADLDGVCGLVLLATPGRPLGVLLREQLRANPANAPLLSQADEAIAALEKGERYDTTAMHPALKSLFNEAVQDFLIDMMAFDPADKASSAPVPLLIVQGGEDLQVGAEDGAALQAARPDAGFVRLATMNHVLKDVPEGDRAANLATYGDPDRPLAAGLVDAITDFLEGHR
ncbi:alpha/beta hydrolase [Qipengyuania sp.]|uniref:alpha/beta hydrolase n=1 Tax=Qipengyuania sp. TaxID=2004515 RepID=UPI0035C817C4